MVKPYKKTIIIVTLMALFIDVCELVKPFLLEQVMDKYLPDKLYVYNGISIAAIVAFYIIIVIIGNIVDYINILKKQMYHFMIKHHRENYM